MLCMPCLKECLTKETLSRPIWANTLKTMHKGECSIPFCFFFPFFSFLSSSFSISIISSVLFSSLSLRFSSKTLLLFSINSKINCSSLQNSLFSSFYSWFSVSLYYLITPSRDLRENFRAFILNILSGNLFKNWNKIALAFTLNYSYVVGRIPYFSKLLGSSSLKFIRWFCRLLDISDLFLCL